MAVSGKPDRGDPATLITVAPTGAEVDKSAVPALPVTVEELVTTAKECQAAGAAVIHVHIRDADAKPTLDIGRLTDTVRALRESTDLIVQLSTGGAVTDSFERRLAVLDAGPDACSLTCGTVNFGDDVFMNPWGFMTELYAKTQSLGVVPEFELFDFGHIAALHRLLAEFGPPAGGHVHCDLVMGVPGGCRGIRRRSCMPSRRCRLVPPGQLPGSDERRCRCCSRLSRRADICGSAWRIQSRSPAAGRSRAMRSWWSELPKPPRLRSARP